MRVGFITNSAFLQRSAAQRIGVLFDVIVWLERTFIRQAHMTYQGIRLGMSAPPPENLSGHDHPKFPF